MRRLAEDIARKIEAMPVWAGHGDLIRTIQTELTHEALIHGIPADEAITVEKALRTFQQNGFDVTDERIRLAIRAAALAVTMNDQPTTRNEDT